VLPDVTSERGDASDRIRSSSVGLNCVAAHAGVARVCGTTNKKKSHIYIGKGFVYVCLEGKEKMQSGALCPTKLAGHRLHAGWCRANQIKPNHSYTDIGAALFME
jgi:hypothetical protein